MMGNPCFSALADAILQEVHSALSSVDPALVDGLAEDVTGARRIFFAGAGRSRLMLSAMAMRLMHIGLTAHVVGEVTAPAIAAGDLLVVASGSGRTPTIVTVAAKAKEAGARVALITMDALSSLANCSDRCITLSQAAMCASVQVGAAVFEQATMILGDALVCMVAHRLGIADVNGVMRQRHSNLE